MTAGTGSDIGSSDRTAGIGSPGIRSFGSTAGTASSGKAQWAPSQQARQWAPGHQASDCLARQRASVTRDQVIWQGSGHRVTRYDSGL
ncbi:unnamed protein product [Staurois parvus]|uniref:Uncharacterized protein n=1 Tax=Staurois parvus TaxID=386267 RepID=A0ABN9ATB2_9NEOB|nr:unnamed protein product [Staurois parvus]